MNLGAFLVVIMMTQATGSDHIDRFRGLAWRGGWPTFLAVCMAIFLFSLAGLPPTAGFIGKVYIFAAVVHERWYWLAVVGVLNSVISLYYYARVVKAMFLDQDREGAEISSQLTLKRLEPSYRVVLMVLAVLTILLGLYWTPLIESSQNALAYIGGTSI
jgi:NADH-quinone oxidoreductase subunit N